MPMMRSASTAVLALLAALSIQPATAADHLNLEPDLPVTIEDAYPIARGGWEVQGISRYQRDDDGNDQLLLEPRLQAGLLPNFEAGISLPFRVIDEGQDKNGRFGVDGLYNFNSEGVYSPALAIAGALSVPGNDRRERTETELEFIATKSLGGYVPRRLHLNVAWTHAYDAAGDQRDDRYRAAIGYSQPVSSNLLFVGDLAREQNLDEGDDANLVEAGLRYQLTPLAVLAVGGGLGLGEDSPDARVTVGFQYALPWLNQ